MPVDTLTKNFVSFCLCSKNLPETKLKSNKVISLVEEISRQCDVEPVWLSLGTLMQVYDITRTRGSERNTCAVWKEMNIRKFSITAKARADREHESAKEVSIIKARHSTPHWNNEKGDLGTIFHTAKLPTRKKKKGLQSFQL